MVYADADTSSAMAVRAIERNANGRLSAKSTAWSEGD